MEVELANLLLDLSRHLRGTREVPEIALRREETTTRIYEEFAARYQHGGKQLPRELFDKAVQQYMEHLLPYRIEHPAPIRFLAQLYVWKTRLALIGFSIAIVAIAIYCSRG